MLHPSENGLFDQCYFVQMVRTIVSDEEAPINFAQHPHKYCGILRRQAW